MQFNRILLKDIDITGARLIYVDLGDKQSVVLRFNHEPTDDEIIACANAYCNQIALQQQITALQAQVINLRTALPLLPSDQQPSVQLQIDDLNQQIVTLGGEPA